MGAFLGATAVILGAFGAHGLESRIDESAIETFNTGVTYQFYHAFLLLLISIFALSEKTKRYVYFFVSIGVLFFSGSIYLLATNALTSFDFKVIALATPLGGTLLIIGWIVLFVNFLKKKSDI